MRIKARQSHGCGRLPLPVGERGGVRGLRSKGRFPLTATLSPMGRGSPAVPRLESVPTRELGVDSNWGWL
jgi:hypothetical protein